MKDFIFDDLPTLLKKAIVKQFGPKALFFPV